MNWQPISTAPKDGTQILLYVPLWHDFKDTISVGWYSDMDLGKGWNVQAFIIKMEDEFVTNWMPLPEPPCSPTE